MLRRASHTPHKAPRGAQHYTRLHDTPPCLRRAPATHRTRRPEGHNTTQGGMTQRHACGGHQPHTAQSTPRGTTLHKAARHTAMLAAGTSHTPHTAPRGAQHYTRLHDTLPCLRRASATHRTKRPEGHKTTQGSTTQRHGLRRAISHTPHKAPRGAQHYTRLHDTPPCLRRAPATHRTKHPEGHNTTQGSTYTTPCLRRASATHRTKRPEGHNTTQGCMTQRHACGGHQPHTAQSTPRGTTLHKAA